MSPTQDSSVRADTTYIKEDPEVLHRLCAETTSLVMWRNPQRSGAVLVGGLGAIVALTSFTSCLFRLATMFAFLGLALNLAYVGVTRLIASFSSGGHAATASASADGAAAAPAAPHPHSGLLRRVRDVKVTERCVVCAATQVVTVAGAAGRGAASILLVEDAKSSLIAAGVLYVLWSLSVFLPVSVLVGTALVAAFSLPKLYDQNKELIDKQLAAVSKITKEKANIVGQQIGKVQSDISAKVAAQLGGAGGAATKEGVKKEE